MILKMFFFLFWKGEAGSCYYIDILYLFGQENFIFIWEKLEFEN